MLIFSNLVPASASPPSGEMSQIFTLPPRSERKARRLPSGGHLGLLSRLAPRGSWELRPVWSSTTQTSEFMAFSSRSAAVAVKATQRPSGEASTPPTDLYVRILSIEFAPARPPPPTTPTHSQTNRRIAFIVLPPSFEFRFSIFVSYGLPAAA